jgi:hypothetical protein
VFSWGDGQASTKVQNQGFFIPAWFWLNMGVGKGNLRVNSAFFWVIQTAGTVRVVSKRYNGLAAVSALP